MVNSTPNSVIPDVCLLSEIVNWEIILIHEESLLRFIELFHVSYIKNVNAELSSYYWKKEKNHRA